MEGGEKETATPKTMFKLFYYFLVISLDVSKQASLRGISTPAPAAAVEAQPLPNMHLSLVRTPALQQRFSQLYSRPRSVGRHISPAHRHPHAPGRRHPLTCSHMQGSAEADSDSWSYVMVRPRTYYPRHVSTSLLRRLRRGARIAAVMAII